MRVLVIGHGLIGKQRARALAALEKSEQHAGAAARGHGRSGRASG